MGSTRRSFTDEYKASAVAFVLDEHRTVAEVARNIDVHEMTLGKWVKKERDDRAASQPADAPLSESERAELIRLRQDYKNAKAENAQLQMQVGGVIASKQRPGEGAWSGEVAGGWDSAEVDRGGSGGDRARAEGWVGVEAYRGGDRSGRVGHLA